MYQLTDRPAKRMGEEFAYGHLYRMDGFIRLEESQPAYLPSHPPAAWSGVENDAQLAYAIHPQNSTSHTSRLTIPPEKLSCIN